MGVRREQRASSSRPALASGRFGLETWRLNAQCLASSFPNSSRWSRDTFSEDVADEMIEEVEKDLDERRLVHRRRQLRPRRDADSGHEAQRDHAGALFQQLVEAYGKHLFGRFHSRYPVFFEGIDNSFDFFRASRTASTPRFASSTRTQSFRASIYPENGSERMVMDYSSSRPFAPLAYGLIQGCIEHFGEASRGRLARPFRGRGDQSTLRAEPSSLRQQTPCRKNA